MVECGTRIVARPAPDVPAAVPVLLWAIVHVSTTISTRRVCNELNASMALPLLVNTEFRMLTLAAPSLASNPSAVDSNRLFSTTASEIVSLPVSFQTPAGFLRHAHLFTIRFDPVAYWRIPAPEPPRPQPATTGFSTASV